MYSDIPLESFRYRGLSHSMNSLEMGIVSSLSLQYQTDSCIGLKLYQGKTLPGLISLEEEVS